MPIRCGTFLASDQESGGAIIAPTCSFEVSMLGRRSHVRVSIETGAEGILSLARDISVRVNNDGHIVAVSRDAGAIGEQVRVAFPDDHLDVVAEVLDSKPIIFDGAVRHRLLMRPIGDGGSQR